MGNQVSTKISKNEVEAMLNTMMKRGQEKVGDSKNAKMGKKMIYGFNCRDIDSVRRIAADDSIFCYEGSEDGMVLDTFLLICETVFASFPDVCITYDSVTEEEPGVVKVRGVRTRGTHTGAPYSFGQFPAVPTSNILVEDECEYTFYMENGRCTRMVLHMMKEGDLIGPAGYYVKIGGKIDF